MSSNAPIPIPNSVGAETPESGPAPVPGMNGLGVAEPLAVEDVVGVAVEVAFTVAVDFGEEVGVLAALVVGVAVAGGVVAWLPAIV